MKFLIWALLLLPIISFGQKLETLHLHTDKDIYLPGETIWFKSYVFSDNSPTLLSTNLYAGLYNAAGKLLKKKQFPIFDGTAAGDFEIPDSIKNNVLQLRVFTKNLSGGSNNAYIKLINLFHKGTVAKEIIPGDIPASQLQFFPEGGTLVSGVINHIAYKAQFADGQPARISGAIRDETNKIIDSIFTTDEGIGKFQLVPQFGKLYKVNWLDQNGQSLQGELPASLLNGAALHTDIVGNKLYYSIQKNNVLPRFNKLHLVVKMNNLTVYKQSLEINNTPQFVNNMNTDSFPPGILHLMLLDSEENILQQKPVFISKKYGLPQINIIEKSTKPKGKNVIEVIVTDTLFNNLSLSVADYDFYKTENGGSIYKELLIAQSKDPLRPAFQKRYTHLMKKIDLILVTNNLKTTNTVTPPVIDDYLSLTVNYKEKNYALPQKSLLTLMINDKVSGKQFLSMEPSNQVSFQKSGLIFYDSAKAYFQVEKNKTLSDKLVLVNNVDVIIPEQIQAAILPLDYVLSKPIQNETLETYAIRKPGKFNDVTTIKEVTVKSRYVNPATKRLLELDNKYASGMFSGLARGSQINVIDDPSAWSASDILTYLVYRLPGIQKQAGALYTSRGQELIKVLTFVDETELPDQIGLSNIPVSQIAYVKFISGIVIGSSFTTTGGALYIYMKKGDEPSAASPNMKVTWMKGYDIGKEFQNPDYSDKATLVNPDFRTTLYWNPYIITEKRNNKIKIVYYNNDVATKHLLILKGFNEDGNLVEVTKVIE